MSDPTLYDFLRDICLPLGIIILTYFLGRREINKYQEKKDKIAKREVLIKESAKLNSLHNAFIHNCYELRLGDIDDEEFLKRQWSFIHKSLDVSSILFGTAKIYYDSKKLEEFKKILQEYASLISRIEKEGYKITQKKFILLGVEIGEIYSKIIEFIKNTEILI